jgi:hypothetical protein
MGLTVGDADLERDLPPMDQPLEPNPQQIRDALSEVLLSIPFRASKQSQHLLQYLVVQTMEGHDEMLKERIVGANVFGRKADYDTGADPIVRVRAADLRKRLAQYYNGDGAKTDIRIEMAPGSYRPVFVSDSQRQAWDQAAQASADGKLSQETHSTTAETSGPPAGIDTPSESLETIPDALLNSVAFRWMRTSLIGAGLIILVLAIACIAMWNHIQSTNRLLYQQF